MKASRVLAQYQHMPSFSGIHRDCQIIVARLKSVLKKRLDDPNVSEDVGEKSTVQGLMYSSFDYFCA